MALEKITLLVVEDNDADFRLEGEYLKESPRIFFEVSRAKCLSDAIKMIEERKFDVALLDLNLPDSKGLAIIDEIRQHDPEIAILVLTGIDDEKLGIEAVQRGAQDYLVKGRMDGGLLHRSIRYALERTRSEAALHASEARFRIMADSIPQFAWIAKPDGYIIWYNRRWYEYTGTTEEQMKGWGWQSVHDPDELPKVLEQWKASIATGQSFNMEFPLRGADGKFRPFLTRGIPLKDAQGHVIQWFGTNTDIAERKQVEEILKRDKETIARLVEARTRQLVDVQMELDRAKRLSDIGTLAATIAHELRNPLAAIAMTAANIQRKIKDGASFERYFQAIQKKVTESDQIINNLLFYSRLRTPDFKKVDIYYILEECAELAEKRCDGQVVFKRGFDSLRDIVVEADVLQLKETFSNLLNNACDAINDGKGVIEITAAHDTNSVRFSIKDNGTGITKENLERIFDPFFTTKAKGTGLGLTVCYQIMKMHGGSIGFSSEPGKGTVVEIVLPKERRVNG